MIETFLRLLHHNDHLLFVHRFAKLRSSHAEEIAPENIRQLIAVQYLTSRLSTALLVRFLTFAQIFGRFVKVETGMLSLQRWQSTFDGIAK